MRKTFFKGTRFSVAHYALRVILSYSFIFSQVSLVFAAPQGAQVEHGSASFNQNGSTTTITTSHNSIINYQSFDIHANETVRFIQPSSSSRVLNRINGAFPTYIDGSLLANGQVYITNPSGVYIGNGAFINVGRLVAAAGTITNADFLNNIDQFTNLNGKVINAGSIEADLVHLVGKEVINSGVILANEGLISMVAGDDVLLGERDGHLFVKISDTRATTDNNAGPSSMENTSETGDSGKETASLGAGDMFSIAIRHNGTLQAAEVVLEGGDTSDIQVSGTIDASDTSPEGVGGNIKVLGDDIEVADAHIDASGTSGGGTVLIGGDFQGTGDIRTASQTTVNSGTSIHADAYVNGDGGEVVIWSEEDTRFSGQISARGGREGGNGGLIETSGKQYLAVVGGQVDASAPKGSSGAWLLDPRNVTIQDATTAGGTFDGLDPNTFTPSADDAIVDRDVVQNSLNGGTSVTITTGADGTQEGNITVTDTITKSAGADATLTFNAANDIIVNAAISSSVGALTVALNATGSVDVNASVVTNGGQFASTGVDFDNTGGAITTGGGAVSLTHDGSVVVREPIDADTGNVTISTGGADAGSNNRFANIISSGTVTITGGSGNDIFLIADGATLPGVIDGAAGIDTLDFSEFTTARSIVLTGLGATDGFSGTEAAVAGGFDGIDVVRGSSGDDTLTGRNADATWTIDGTNQYVSTNTLDFSEIENFTGGTGNDRFELMDGGSISGMINGGGQTTTDEFDVSAVTAPVSVALSEVVDVESVVGDGANDTLIGRNTGETWQITGANSGSVNGTDFTNFSNLTGGSEDDSFQFADGGSISGTLDGGDQTTADEYDVSAVTAPVTVTLSDLVNMESVVGDGTNDTLIGRDTGETWQITGVNAGSVNGTDFTDFSNLTGGNGDDRFQFADGGSISGTLDGGGQTTADEYDVSAVTAPVAVTLSDLVNMESVVGDGTNDTLIGDDSGQTWQISGANTGTVNGTNFSDFPNLAGGVGDDRFELLDGGGVSGTLDGGGQTTADEYDVSAVTAPVTVGVSSLVNIESVIGDGTNDTLVGGDTGETWQITGMNAGSVNGTDFTDFSNLTGGSGGDTFSLNGGSLTGHINAGDGSDTLLGDNMANTFEITGENSGTATGVDGGFSAVENLTGGTAVDSIILMDGGSLDGIVRGGEGTDTVQVIGSASNTGDEITISANGVQLQVERTNLVPYNMTIETVENLELNSQDGGDTILVGDLSGVADLTNFSIDAGAGDDTISAGFANFSIVIAGGSGVDNIVGGSGSDRISGGLGDDTLSGGAGDDLFVWNDGDGFDRITGGVGDDTVQVNGANIAAGDVFALSANNTRLVIEQANQMVLDIGSSETIDVNSLAGEDEITVNDLSGITDVTELNLNGGADSDTINAADLPDGVIATVTIDGGSGDDVLTGSGGGDTLVGGPGDDMLTGGQGVDEIFGEDDIDTVIWNDGDGDDVINAGNGSDILQVNASADNTTGDVLVVNANGTQAQIERTNLTPFTLDVETIETIQLNSLDGDDDITINDLTGVSDLTTFAVDGGFGADMLRINGSVDPAIGDDLVMSINGTGGIQIERTNPAPFMWDANMIETLQVNSQDGGDTITVNDLSGTADLTSLNIDGGLGNDIIDASALPESVVSVLALLGNDGADMLTGSSGADTLTGGSGDDTVNGGAGDDIIVWNDGDGSDQIDGGDGADTVEINGSSDAAAGDQLTVRANGTATQVERTNITPFTLDLNTVEILDVNTLDGDDTITINDLSGIADLATFNIDGSVGNDTLDIANAGGGSNTVDLESSSVSGVIDSFSSIESFVGAGDTDTLRVNNAASVINVTGENDGDIDTGVQFTDFGIVEAGSGGDTFDVAAGGRLVRATGGGDSDTLDLADAGGSNTVDLEGSSVSGVIDSFSSIESFVGAGDTDTLRVNNAASVINVTGENDGDIDTGVQFTDFGIVEAGSGGDTFDVAAGGRLVRATGGGDNDTLDLADAGGSNTVDLEESSVSGVIDSFSSIESFVGAGDTDTLQVNNAASVINVTGENDGDIDTAVQFTDFGIVEAGSGGDTFDVAAGGRLVRATGGGDSDTLDLADAGGSNTVDLEESSVSGVIDSFSSIESFVGAGDTDTLQVNNAASVINVTGENDGDIDTAVQFTDFGIVEAGSGGDTFDIAAGGRLVRATGGGDSDTLDLADAGGSNTVDLEGSSVSGVIDSFSSIESFVGAGDTDTLRVNNAASVINVTGENDGDIDTGVQFTDFGIVEAGSGGDTFDVAAGGRLVRATGGGDSDTLDLADAGGSNTVDLEGSTVSGVIDSFSSIESFVGAGDTDTLQVNNAASVINVTGENDGDIDTAVQFMDFGIVEAGSGGDTFDVAAGGRLVRATGGGDSDTLDLADAGGSNTVDLEESSVSGVIDSFSSIESFVGAGDTDTLQVNNAASVINVTGENDGDIDTGVQFTDFGIVEAGSGGDTFDVAAGGRLVRATGGGDSDTLDLADAGGSNTVDLEGSTVSGVIDSFSSIESFVGAGDTDTLQVNNAASVINVTGENDGDIDTGVQFTDFGIVEAGSGGDTFDVAAGGRLVRATGGGDSDTLDLADSGGSNTVDLEGSTVSGVIDSFSSIESFVGAGDTDTLQVNNAASVINVTGENDGDIDTGVQFTDFGIVEAGVGGDTFDIAAGGRLVRATGGGDNDTLDLADAGGSNTVDLEGSTVSGVIDSFSSIESFVGSGDTDTLRVNNAATTINVTGENDGDIDSGVQFRDFGIVEVGTGGDTVNLNAGGRLANLVGGEGDDNFVLNDGASVDGTITGEGGDDSLLVNGSIDPAEGDNFTISANGAQARIMRTNISTPFTLDLETTETLEINSQEGNDTIAVDDLDGVADLKTLNLNGGDGIDTVQVNGASDNTTGDVFVIRGDGTDVQIERTNLTPLSLNNTAVETVKIDTLAGNDTIHVESSLNLDGTLELNTENINIQGPDATITADNVSLPGENTALKGEGNVTFNTPITTPGTLEIQSDSGALNLSLNGAVESGESVFMDTAGGNVSFGAPISVRRTLEIETDGGNLTTAISPNRSDISIVNPRSNEPNGGNIPGRLNIRTNGGNITMGDISVSSTIDIDAGNGALTVVRRENRDINVFNDQLSLPNRGVTISAADRIVINAGDIRLAGAGRAPVLITEDGSGIIQNIDSGNILTSGSPFAVSSDVARAIAGAVPKQDVDVPQEISIGTAEKEQLRQLGIYSRDLTGEELTRLNSGAGTFYNDIPTKENELAAGQLAIDMKPWDYKVAVGRLSEELAGDALENYYRIFWREAMNEATGQAELDDDGNPVLESKVTEVQQTLQAALDVYKAQTGIRKVDPVGCREFINKSPECTEARDILNRLRKLFKQVELLGLTATEFEISKRVLLRPIKLRGMRSEKLETLIEAVVEDDLAMNHTE